MRTLVPSSVRRSLLKLAVSSALVLSFVASAVAGPQKTVNVSATGQIGLPVFVSPKQVCQDVEVTGVATVIGPVSGALSECVNLGDLTYTGLGVFTTPD